MRKQKNSPKELNVFTLLSTFIAAVLTGIAMHYCYEADLFSGMASKIRMPLFMGILFAAFLLITGIVVFVSSNLKLTFLADVITGKRETGRIWLYMLSVALVLGLFLFGAEFLYEQNFHRTEAGPSNYVFLIDDSGSMAENDPEETRYKVLEAILGEKSPKTSFAVYSFSTNVALTTPMQTVADGFPEPPIPNFLLTNMKAGLEKVVSDYENGIWSSKGETSLILITDGIPSDFSSFQEIRPILDRCKANNITLGIVGVIGADINLMTEIAAYTGGTFTDIHDIAQLTEAVRMVSGDEGVTRNLLSERDEVEMEWLYAMIRVLAIAIAGVLIAVAAAFCYGNNTVFGFIIGANAVKAVVAGILLEAGFLLAPAAGPVLRIVAWVLLGTVIARCGSSGGREMKDTMDLNFFEEDERTVRSYGNQKAAPNGKVPAILGIVAACLVILVIAMGILIFCVSASDDAAAPEDNGSISLPVGENKKDKVEIVQVLPMNDGSVAALYTDGTVRVSGNAIPAEAVKDWADVAQIYYNEKADWENGAFRYTHCLMALTEDGSVLSTTGDFSGWSDVKELILNWAGAVGVTNDGRVLAQGDWEDPSFLTSLTNVEALVPSSIQSAWGCVKKDGTVIFTDEYGYVNPNEVCWTNVKELWDTGHSFYVVKNDGSVESDMLGICTGLKDAVKTTSFRDWVFGISADGRLLTHDNGSIYPNMGCMMVDAPGSDYYGGEVDIRDFDQVKDIVIFDGMILLNEDGTVYHIPNLVEWDLHDWDHIEKIYGAWDGDWDDKMIYGIKQDGSVIQTYYYQEQQTQTTTDQYLGWKLQEIYTGEGGVVGLTTDGKLVGDGIYAYTDFSVF